MKRVVILQPQFLPWRGVFEQIRLADIYVHLDDVDLPQGRNLLSRVKIKTPQGSQWLTLPIRKNRAKIREIEIDESQPWRKHHLRSLKLNYARAPFCDQMVALAEAIYSSPTRYLAEFNIQAIEKISSFLGLPASFRRASDFPSDKTSTERLVELSMEMGAGFYLTGQGARNYLQTPQFDAKGIAVEIMDYRRTPYSQLFGGFDPHVSILDLIANTGGQAPRFLDSDNIPWSEDERDRKIPDGSHPEH